MFCSLVAEYPTEQISPTVSQYDLARAPSVAASQSDLDTMVPSMVAIIVWNVPLNSSAILSLRRATSGIYEVDYGVATIDSKMVLSP